MIRGTPPTAMATLLAYGWLTLSKNRPIQDGGGPADRVKVHCRFRSRTLSGMHGMDI